MNLWACDRCHFPRLVLAVVGRNWLCRSCTGTLQPTAFVYGIAA